MTCFADEPLVNVGRADVVTAVVVLTLAVVVAVVTTTDVLFMLFVILWVECAAEE